MAVNNGDPVDAPTTNAAFVSKTVDSTVQSKINLANGDVNSGAAVNNVQRAINETFATVGIAGVGDAGATDYSSNNVLVDGESHKQGLEKMDEKYHGSTGHGHSGVNGDGPPISANSLTDFNRFFCEFGSFSKTGVSGLSSDVSGELTGKIAGGDVATAGVVTTAPFNRVDIVRSTDYTYIEDAEGQRVYGRLTGAAAVFTLTFYTNEAGVETPHNLAMDDIMVLYREVFTASTRPTIPSNPLEFGTLDITADVKDASTSQRGVVTTGAQSFAGDKIHTGKQTLQSRFAFMESSDGATTGASALLANPTTAIVRLTNALLTSIATIDLDSASQVFILVNNTGNDIDLLDLAGAPAGKQISTGNGDFTLMDGASCMVVRGDTAQKWYIVGGGGGSSSPLTTKGDLWGFDGTVDVRVPVGADGTFLVGDSTNPNGVAYRFLNAGDLPVVPIAKGGTGEVTAAAAFIALSPTTTKGDIIVDDGTSPVRQAVGLDGQVPTADSTAATGISYKYPAQGNKNYFPPEVSQGNTVSGFNNYLDASGLKPVDGTGGVASGNLSLTSSSSAPLSGLKSIILSKTGSANLQGEGKSWDITLDDSDKGKFLALTGSYAVTTNYADDDLIFYFYDVTNGVLLEPTPFNIKKHTLESERFFSEVQIPYNCDTLRFIIHQSSTTTQNYDLKLDDLVFGPQAKQYGSADIDWKPFVATGSWNTNTTYTGWYKQKGDSVDIRYKLNLTGAPNAAVLTLNMIPGFVIDTTKASLLTVLGHVLDSGTDEYPVTFKISSSTSFSGTTVVPNGTAAGFVGIGNNLTNTAPITFANGDIVDVTFYGIPVVGLSSSQLLSHDATTRVIGMSAETLGGFTANTATAKVTGFTASVDENGSFSGDTWTCRVPGLYLSAFEVSTGPNGGTKVASIRKNGSSVVTGLGGLNAYTPISGGKLVRFNAGDTAEMYYNNTTGSEAWYVYDWTMMLVSGPAQIQASERIFAKATLSSGQSIPTATETRVQYNNILNNTHGAFTSGASAKFICPRSDYYKFIVFNMFDFATWAATSFGQIKAYRLAPGGGTLEGSVLDVYTADATQCRANLSGGSGFYCNAGDEISFWIYQDSGSSKTLTNSGEYNHVIIYTGGE